MTWWFRRAWKVSWEAGQRQETDLGASKADKKVPALYRRSSVGLITEPHEDGREALGSLRINTRCSNIHAQGLTTR